MNRKQPTQSRVTIFLRYQNGTRIEVNFEIQKAIKDALNVISKGTEPLKSINSLIKREGQYAIGPHSTWPALLRELFNTFDVSSKSEKSDALIEVLSIVAEKPVAKNWNKIKEKIIKNIEVLSRWNEYSEPRKNMFLEIYKKSNGKRYMKINGQEAEVIGGKTFEESRFQMIAEDVLREYGSINSLLRTIVLCDVASQFKRDKFQFPEKINYVFSECETQTWFLRWRVIAEGATDSVPIFWRPQSCFSDPEWLANDLLASFADQHEIYELDNIAPNASGAEIYEEKFKDYSRQYEVALDTDLYLGSEEEVYFNFLDMPLRWVNGTGFNSPVLIIPYNDENLDEAVKIGKKFISILTKEEGMPITEISSIGKVKSYRPGSKAPRALGGLQIDPRYLFSKNPSDYSEKEWIGLAHYREGISSKSNLYSFLCFYKVLELALDNDTSKVLEWIDKNIDEVVQKVDIKWPEEVLKTGMKAGNYLYGVDRCAIAHIENKKKTPSNPDDLEELKRIARDVHIIHGLANLIFTQKLLEN